MPRLLVLHQFPMELNHVERRIPGHAGLGFKSTSRFVILFITFGIIVYDLFLEGKGLD